MPPPHLEVVIAHFNEDLAWLHPHESSCTIYYKGTPPSPPSSSSYRAVQPLPNISRETGTYLHHILTHYSPSTTSAGLADITLFLQGDIHSWNSGTPCHTFLPLSAIISESLKLQPNQILSIGPIRTFGGSAWSGLPWLTDGTGYFQRRGKTMTMSALTPAQFWSHVFQSPGHPDRVDFAGGALFAVPRAVVLARPRAFWARLAAYFDGLASPNPEEGHFMERFWLSVFTPEGTERMRSEVVERDRRQWDEMKAEKARRETAEKGEEAAEGPAEVGLGRGW